MLLLNFYEYIEMKKFLNIQEKFTNIQRYVINNFGNPISAISIQKYYNKTNRNVDIRTIENTSSFYVILKFYIHAIPLI